MSPIQPTPDFRQMPFSEVIEKDAGLAELRRSYASRTPKERRRAAEWSYDSSIASELFSSSLRASGLTSPFNQEWPAGVVSLAIDPEYAPALLTIGSIEYQLGRKDHAMAMFTAILRCPADTEDLVEIIDKAGTFLVQQGDPEAARFFYETACAQLPNTTVLLAGLSHALGKLKQLDDAIAVQRRAVALDPKNHLLLTDLGWHLTCNGNYQEAEQVLTQAVALSPPGHQLAQENLKQLHRLIKQARPANKPRKK